MEFKRHFKTYFLKEARRFIHSLDHKTRKKVLFNIYCVEHQADVELFKKLNNEIWEFRTKYVGIQVRLLAFWHKKPSEETQVIITHGFIKKTWKIPGKEIKKAESIKSKFLLQ